MERDQMHHRPEAGFGMGQKTASPNVVKPFGDRVI